jgi:hypothetical protein
LMVELLSNNVYTPCVDVFGAISAESCVSWWKRNCPVRAEAEAVV